MRMHFEGRNLRKVEQDLLEDRRGNERGPIQRSGLSCRRVALPSRGTDGGVASWWGWVRDLGGRRGQWARHPCRDAGQMAGRSVSFWWGAWAEGTNWGVVRRWFLQRLSEIIVSPEHSPCGRVLVVPALPRGHLLSQAASAHSGQGACPPWPLTPSQCSQPRALSEITCVPACRAVTP